MGYQTHHTLIIHTIEEETAKSIKEFIDEYENEKWELYETYYEVGEPRKWSRSDDDMKELSLIFPHVLFELHGEGDESGDVWKAYYKDGKVQYCQARLVFDEFDESKLK